MNCIPILKSKGYNLKGYSPDMYANLIDNDISNIDDCEAWFAYIEMVYG